MGALRQIKTLAEMKLLKTNYPLAEVKRKPRCKSIGELLN